MFIINKLIFKLFKKRINFHLVSRRNFSMPLNCFNKYFLYGIRKSFFIMNFEEFIFNFRITLFFLLRMVSLRGKILAVDTREFLRSCVVYFLIKSKHFYQVNKWIGGTLSNFKFFRSFYIFIYKKKMPFLKYFSLVKYYRGILGMKQLPNLIICTNVEDQLTVLQESFRVGIATCSTITPFSSNFCVTFPIMYNYNDRSSMIFFYQILRNCLFLGLFKEIFIFFKNFFDRIKKIRKYYFFLSNLSLRKSYNIFSEFYEKLFSNNLKSLFIFDSKKKNNQFILKNFLLSNFQTKILKMGTAKLDISYLNDFSNLLLFNDFNKLRFFISSKLKNFDLGFLKLNLKIFKFDINNFIYKNLILRRHFCVLKFNKFFCFFKNVKFFYNRFKGSLQILSLIKFKFIFLLLNLKNYINKDYFLINLSLLTFLFKYVNNDFIGCFKDYFIDRNFIKKDSSFNKFLINIYFNKKCFFSIFKYELDRLKIFKLKKKKLFRQFFISRKIFDYFSVFYIRNLKKFLFKKFIKFIYLDTSLDKFGILFNKKFNKILFYNKNFNLNYIYKKIKFLESKIVDNFFFNKYKLFINLKKKKKINKYFKLFKCFFVKFFEKNNRMFFNLKNKSFKKKIHNSIKKVFNFQRKKLNKLGVFFKILKTKKNNFYKKKKKKKKLKKKFFRLKYKNKKLYKFLKKLKKKRKLKIKISNKLKKYFLYKRRNFFFFKNIGRFLKKKLRILILKKKFKKIVRLRKFIKFRIINVIKGKKKLKKLLYNGLIFSRAGRCLKDTIFKLYYHIVLYKYSLKSVSFFRNFLSYLFHSNNILYKFNFFYFLKKNKRYEEFLFFFKKYANNFQFFRNSDLAMIKKFKSLRKGYKLFRNPLFIKKSLIYDVYPSEEKKDYQRIVYYIKKRIKKGLKNLTSGKIKKFLVGWFIKKLNKSSKFLKNSNIKTSLDFFKIVNKKLLTNNFLLYKNFIKKIKLFSFKFWKKSSIFWFLTRYKRVKLKSRRKKLKKWRRLSVNRIKAKIFFPKKKFYRIRINFFFINDFNNSQNYFFNLKKKMVNLNKKLKNKFNQRYFYFNFMKLRNLKFIKLKKRKNNNMLINIVINFKFIFKNFNLIKIIKKNLINSLNYKYYIFNYDFYNLNLKKTRVIKMLPYFYKFKLLFLKKKHFINNRFKIRYGQRRISKRMGIRSIRHYWFEPKLYKLIKTRYVFKYVRFIKRKRFNKFFAKIEDNKYIKKIKTVFFFILKKNKLINKFYFRFLIKIKCNSKIKVKINKFKKFINFRKTKFNNNYKCVKFKLINGFDLAKKKHFFFSRSVSDFLIFNFLKKNSYNILMNNLSFYDITVNSFNNVNFFNKIFLFHVFYYKLLNKSYFLFNSNNKTFFNEYKHRVNFFLIIKKFFKSFIYLKLFTNFLFYKIKFFFSKIQSLNSFFFKFIIRKIIFLNYRFKIKKLALYFRFNFKKILLRKKYNFFFNKFVFNNFIKLKKTRLNFFKFNVNFFKFNTINQMNKFFKYNFLLKKNVIFSINNKNKLKGLIDLSKKNYKIYSSKNNLFFSSANNNLKNISFLDNKFKFFLKKGFYGLLSNSNSKIDKKLVNRLFFVLFLKIFRYIRIGKKKRAFGWFLKNNWRTRRVFINYIKLILRPKELKKKNKQQRYYLRKYKYNKYNRYIKHSRYNKYNRYGKRYRYKFIFYHYSDFRFKKSFKIFKVLSYYYYKKFKKNHKLSVLKKNIYLNKNYFNRKYLKNSMRNKNSFFFVKNKLKSCFLNFIKLYNRFLIYKKKISYLFKKKLINLKKLNVSFDNFKLIQNNKKKKIVEKFDNKFFVFSKPKKIKKFNDFKFTLFFPIKDNINFVIKQKISKKIKFFNFFEKFSKKKLHLSVLKKLIYSKYFLGKDILKFKFLFFLTSFSHPLVKKSGFFFFNLKNKVLKKLKKDKNFVIINIRKNVKIFLIKMIFLKSNLWKKKKIKRYLRKFKFKSSKFIKILKNKINNKINFNLRVFLKKNKFNKKINNNLKSAKFLRKKNNGNFFQILKNVYGKKFYRTFFKIKDKNKKLKFLVYYKRKFKKRLKRKKYLSKKKFKKEIKGFYLIKRKRRRRKFFFKGNIYFFNISQLKNIKKFVSLTISINDYRKKFFYNFVNNLIVNKINIKNKFFKIKYIKMLQKILIEHKLKKSLFLLNVLKNKILKKFSKLYSKNIEFLKYKKIVNLINKKIDNNCFLNNKFVDKFSFENINNNFLDLYKKRKKILLRSLKGKRFHSFFYRYYGKKVFFFRINRVKFIVDFLSNHFKGSFHFYDDNKKKFFNVIQNYAMVFSYYRIEKIHNNFFFKMNNNNNNISSLFKNTDEILLTIRKRREQRAVNLRILPLRDYIRTFKFVNFDLKNSFDKKYVTLSLNNFLFSFLSLDFFNINNLKNSKINSTISVKILSNIINRIL